MSNVDQCFRDSLARAHEMACDALIAERTRDGYWLGELSSSALSTATAVSALSLVREAIQSEPAVSDGRPAEFNAQISKLIDHGLRWLADHQNADGGWGDTTLSFSNISTTMLVRAAFHLAGDAEKSSAILGRATDYIDRQGGAAAVASRYGKDRTFAVPILANCALAGQADWRDVASLPFELACLPHSWFRFLRLHVVSYALPALIAIGQLIHAKRPSLNLLARAIRNLATGPTLKKLEAIQPASGGFLEAIPLTSFVTMSLAAIGRVDHPVTRKGVEFLVNTARPDGSWPIDSNLSVWLTTLSVNALADRSFGSARMSGADAQTTRDWLLAQQLREVHPYTNAAAGGWGWSHLSGSVPDADDTAGALLALTHLPSCEESRRATIAGIRWLLDLQNRDGGWPTFCRGWGKLPFDRSGADLTAHAIRAITQSSISEAPPVPNRDNEFRQIKVRAATASLRGFKFLRRFQDSRGYWSPLWFGNHHLPDDENQTYGTARVLLAYGQWVSAFRSQVRWTNSLRPIERRELQMLWELPETRAIEWLAAAQTADGGWGGGLDAPASVEETGLAIEALAGVSTNERASAALRRGVQWLIDRVESGDWRKPSPIGLYFAKLWYFEKLYPIIFTVAGLGRARRALDR
jgi:squalene-hopene/tetraprenyl-beta-curcumene cyclase